MNNPNIPSISPAQTGSLEGLIELALRKDGMQTDGQLPCEVLSYDRVSNRATVRPLIYKVATSGNLTSRGQVASVPVLALGGGGYTVTFPLVRGSLGWIEASDRDISLFLQSMKEAPPNTFRFHDFSSGRFIPDAFRAYTFDATDDAASMVIQSYDGTVKICLDPAKVRVIAPTVAVMASAAATVTTAAATVTASATLNMNVGASSIAMTPSSVNISSGAIGLHQTGGGAGATFTGAPVVMPDAIIAGVQQSTHVHGGVQSGSSNSSGPHN